MIKRLNIENFKSIKHLHLDCKKINIFIGAPNTGKSNILESIGILSLPYGNIREFVRFEDMSNLFYDQELSETIKVTADDYYFETKFDGQKFNGKFEEQKQANPLGYFSYNLDYNAIGSLNIQPRTHRFKLYKFEVISVFNRPESDFLIPPKGGNLLSVLQTKKELRKMVADLFSDFRLRIVFEPVEKKIKVQKEIEDVIISYPYSLVSDTLQRIVFHLVAIESNRNSVIIFEEPEAHAFPYYTKFLAETIARDKTNQYFISTHNPYFLLSLIEKSPKDDINVFITYFKDYQTGVRPLTQKEMSEALDLEESIFFNLDKFLGEE